MASALLELPSDTVIDGEVVALDKNGKPSFNLLQGFGSEAEMVLYTFDLLMLRGKDVRCWPLEERRESLCEIARQLPSTIRYSERFDAPLPELIRAVRQYRLEGIVAKRAGSPLSFRRAMWRLAKVAGQSRVGIHRRLHSQR